MTSLRRFACALLVLSACAPGAHDGGSAAARADSAGVQIITSDWNAETPVWRRIDPAPQLVLGADESDERTVLAGVTGAAFLPDGEVVVANAMSRQLLVHDERGALVRTMGGAGEGPGEFRDVGAVWRLGDDTVAAFDRRLLRVVMFDGRGELMRSVAPAPAADGRGMPIHAVLGVFGDATLLARSSRMPSDGSTGKVRASDVLYRLSASGDSLRELRAHPGQELHISPDDGGRFSVRVAPFGRNAFVAVRDMRYWVGDSDVPEVRSHSADGRLVSIVRWRRPPVAIVDAHIGRLVEEGLDRWPADQRDRVSRERRGMVTHTTLPAFADMLLDDESRLWIRRYDGGDSTDGWWDLFAEDGERLGVVPMERRWRLLAAERERVLLLVRDSLDREIVRVHRLIEP